MMNSRARVRQRAALLRSLRGATLEWSVLSASHSIVGFLVTGQGQPVRELICLATGFMDCPSEMRNVRMRVASSEETDTLRRRLPEEVVEDLERDDYLVIECEEGTYSLWARGIEIDSSGEEYLTRVYGPEFVESLSRPLWPSGAPVGEL